MSTTIELMQSTALVLLAVGQLLIVWALHRIHRWQKLQEQINTHQMGFNKTQIEINRGAWPKWPNLGTTRVDHDA